MQQIVGYDEPSSEAPPSYDDSPPESSENLQSTSSGDGRFVSEFHRDLVKLRERLDMLIIGLSELPDDEVQAKFQCEELAGVFQECKGRQSKVRKMIEEDIEGEYIGKTLKLSSTSLNRRHCGIVF